MPHGDDWEVAALGPPFLAKRDTRGVQPFATLRINSGSAFAAWATGSPGSRIGFAPVPLIRPFVRRTAYSVHPELVCKVFP